MAAAFPSSLCPASQRQVSFKKHEQVLHHHCELFNVCRKSMGLARYFHNKVSQLVMDSEAAETSGVMRHGMPQVSHEVPTCVWQLMSQLGGSLGPGKLTDVKISMSRGQDTSALRPCTSAPERLMFSALCELLKWFGKCILRSQSFLERILSWDRVAFVSTTASCCFRLIWKVRQALIAVAVPPFSCSFQEKFWKT